MGLNRSPRPSSLATAANRARLRDPLGDGHERVFQAFDPAAEFDHIELGPNEPLQKRGEFGFIPCELEGGDSLGKVNVPHEGLLAEKVFQLLGVAEHADRDRRSVAPPLRGALCLIDFRHGPAGQ